MRLQGLVPVQSVVLPRLNSEIRADLFKAGTGARQSINVTSLRTSTHTQSIRKIPARSVASFQHTSVSSTLTTLTVIDGTTTRLIYRRSVLTVTA
jgi:hypothetical protein